MSLLSALFGGAGGLSALQPPEMAGNLNFGQRLMSGSPVNSLMNGPFPDAPGQQGGVMRNLQQGLQGMGGQQPQPMQLAPMAQAQGGPDLATILQQFMSQQQYGGR